MLIGVNRYCHELLHRGSPYGPLWRVWLPVGQSCCRRHIIKQAVENALSNLMALVEMGHMEFDKPEDMAHVAEQMIRASMDRMGIEDVVGLGVTCVAVTRGHF